METLSHATSRAATPPATSHAATSRATCRCLIFISSSPGSTHPCTHAAALFNRIFSSWPTFISWLCSSHPPARGSFSSCSAHSAPPASLKAIAFTLAPSARAGFSC